MPQGGLGCGIGEPSLTAMTHQEEPNSWNPEPWEDPANSSTLEFHNLHQRSVSVQNWGFHFLDPPRALG